jgi:hypothetical protein
VWYSYAVIRVVPRVEREEFVNVGVVLLARARRFLRARVELNAARVRALSPGADLPLIERHLRTFRAIAAGETEGGPLAALPPAERFHWLTAPRSTVIQTSPVHIGRGADLEAAIEELLEGLVRVAGGG